MPTANIITTLKRFRSQLSEPVIVNRRLTEFTKVMGKYCKTRPQELEFK